MNDLYIESRLQAIKDIASASCADEKDANNITGFCDEIYSAIPKLDKVISQLGDYGNEEIDYYRNTPYENCIRECVSKAIEIVKQGGISDDVCEWRIVDRPHNLPIYNTSCGKIRMQYTTGVDIYCNGCGKKIKEVE